MNLLNWLSGRVAFIACSFLFALSLLGFLGIAVSPSFSATNLLQNPGFESGIAGWTHFGGVFSQSSDYAKEGIYSGKLESTTASTKYIYQVASVVPGSTYKATGFGLKIGATDSEVFLRVAWYASSDGSGSQMTNTADSNVLTSNLSSFTFLETDSLTVPDGANSARVRASIKTVSSTLATVYFDSLSFYEVEAASTSLSPSAQQTQTQQQATTNTPSPPSVTFSAPSSVSAEQEFSVTVNLSNFEAGTYNLKVLVWQGESNKYGNTQGESGWLTQGAAWSKFPTIVIPSSGLASAAVSAKVDDDAPAGNYEIQVRVHKDDRNYDSSRQPLAVSSAPLVAPVASASVNNANSTNAKEKVDQEEVASAVLPADKGEVLGEDIQKKIGLLKSNFYLILGLLSFLVGGGGLVWVRWGSKMPINRVGQFILEFRQRLPQRQKEGSQKSGSENL